MKRIVLFLVITLLSISVFAVDISKLSQLKNIDVEKIENSSEPDEEMITQLSKEYSNLIRKVDFMRDDGNDYKKYLHFSPIVDDYIYCYIVQYKDNSFYLVMEYKNEEIFFSSEILETNIYLNEEGDPIYSDAPGVAIKIRAKAGETIILDDVNSSFDYFVIW